MSTGDESQEPVFRVLSLDGGGMRGLYTASLLEHLSANLWKGTGTADIGKGFDLIVGTSTGGILACALAFGLSVRKIVELYNTHGPKIFVDPMPDGFSRYTWAGRNQHKAADDHSALRNALLELFGEITVKQLYEKRKIAFCIPSVKMLRETARVFKTGHNPEKCADDAIKIVDVCMATSAAPIFLPLAEVPNGDKIDGVYADGGLWANNPVLVGLLEALSMTDTKDRIQIVSVGTCGAPPGTVISKDQLNRGVLEWGVGTEALSVSMNAQASGAAYMAKFFATELGRLQKEIQIIRIPQGQVSAEHIKLLQMDLASPEARKLFTELGQADAIEALRQCQTPMTADGEVLRSIIAKLPAVQ